MTELDLIVDLHKGSQRQGPGSHADTLTALQCIPNSQHIKSVLDLGCGTGGQTLILAQHLRAKILGVDLFKPFLDELNVQAKREGADSQISTLQKSMDDLTFTEKFDLIWSEGAIYNLGFKNGITQWKEHLKSGGYLAVSEITWITPSRPKEIEDFWNSAYPEISQAHQKIQQLEEAGYNLVGYHYLPQNSWTQTYYEPLKRIIPEFLERHKHSELAQKVAQENLDEIALYEKYKDYYSYGFYVAQKM